MSRVFALGTGPVPGAGARVTGAHGLRTWQLVKPLLDAGHEVALFTLPVADPDAPGRHQAGLDHAVHEGFAYRAFRNADLAWAAHVLPGLMAEFRPDALLGINVGPAALLASLPGVAAWAADAPPLWADLYGSATLEAQAKAARDGTDALLAHGWRMERAALMRADRVSAVSRRQADFAYGQLGALGRLNRFTFETELVHVITASANPDFESATPADLRDPASGALAPEPPLPAGAFAALWSGGYNAWTDFDLLLTALLSAMDRAPTLHYVSTGGAVHGHDDASYPRFRDAAMASRHAARFRFLGWIDAARVPGLTAGADLGLVADSPNVETRFGTRTRVVNMLAAGLPVLMTAGTELAETLAGPDGPGPAAATLVPGGDAEALADALARLASAPVPHCARHTARDWARRNASPDAAAAPLLAWAADPRPAPDRGHPPPPDFDTPTQDSQHDPQPGRPRWKRVLREALGHRLYDGLALRRQQPDTHADGVSR